jgi:hypothetical protein
MNTDLSNRITTKLFAGYLVTSELKMHLAQSKTYKQAKINAEPDLVESHYHDKDYLGLYLPQSQIPFSELKNIETEISKKVEHYCPQFNTEQANLFIIPQVFVK